MWIISNNEFNPIEILRQNKAELYDNSFSLSWQGKYMQRKVNYYIFVNNNMLYKHKVIEDCFIHTKSV